MSAYDKLGLAMIPSGYKGEADENNAGGFLGKVYSVLPAQTTSDNLVTNGTFDTDSDWTKIGVVNISNGVATLDGDGQTTICYQSNIIEEGKNYTATFEILNYNGLGEGRIIDDTGAPYYTITQDGVFTISFKAKVHSTGVFYFRARSGAVFSIDNVSVQLISDGDFDFSRGSDATRVNSQGYIESVQVIGDNIVQNGGFEEIGDERLNYTTFSLESDNLVSNPSVSSTLATQSREFAPPIEGSQTEEIGPVHIDYGGGAGANLITNHDFSTGFVTTPGTGWEDPASEHSITNGVLTLNNNTNSTYSTPVNALEQSISSLQKSTSYYVEMDIDSFQLSSGARLVGQIGENKDLLILETSVSYNLVPEISTGFIRSVLFKRCLDFNNNQSIKLWIVSSNASDYIDFNSIELKIANTSSSNSRNAKCKKIKKCKINAFKSRV